MYIMVYRYLVQLVYIYKLFGRSLLDHSLSVSRIYFRKIIIIKYIRDCSSAVYFRKEIITILFANHSAKIKWARLHIYYYYIIYVCRRVLEPYNYNTIQASSAGEFDRP